MKNKFDSPFSDENFWNSPRINKRQKNIVVLDYKLHKEELLSEDPSHIKTEQWTAIAYGQKNTHQHTVLQ